MAISNQDFTAAATKTYEALKPEFNASSNFWRLGHTFDTIIDYFTTVTTSDAQKFAEVACKRYNTTVDPTARQACLYDDFGWWGIAGLKASQSAYFGEWTARFKEIAPSCWKTLDGKGVTVWENADKKKWGQLKPWAEGGVWNCAWSDSDVPGDCATPCNPLAGKDAIRGFQNTVTNGLYFVLAARLYAASNDLQFRVAAGREYKFLSDWFKAHDPVNPRVEPLLNSYASGKAVVRERVSAYDSNEEMFGYNPKLAWAGDQGLILGGLVDRMRYMSSGTEYKEMLDFAVQILRGVRDHLVVSDILQPWTPDQSPPAGDYSDYCTGIAVCMRYLFYAWQNNTALRSVMAESDYQRFIKTNADQVIAHPGDCNADKMVNLTNDLAVLVTAIGMGV